MDDNRYERSVVLRRYCIYLSVAVVVLFCFAVWLAIQVDKKNQQAEVIYIESEFNHSVPLKIIESMVTCMINEERENPCVHAGERFFSKILSEDVDVLVNEVSAPDKKMYKVVDSDVQCGYSESEDRFFCETSANYRKREFLNPGKSKDKPKSISKRYQLSFGVDKNARYLKILNFTAKKVI